MTLQNKYFVKVKFGKHAEDRIERFFGISKNCLIRDIRQQVFNLVKERGSNNLYRLIGKIAKYIISIEGTDIKVITILYIDNKKKNLKDIYLGRKYKNLTKKEIKTLLDIR